MGYEIHLKPSAEKELARFPDVIHDRISGRILALENNPRPRGAKKLSGREEYRLRVGDYRVLYVIDDKAHAVTVSAVDHRREAYRR